MDDGVDDLDPFVLYGTEYEELRRKIMYSQITIKALLEEANVCKQHSNFLIFLTLFFLICTDNKRDSIGHSCLCYVQKTWYSSS